MKALTTALFVLFLFNYSYGMNFAFNLARYRKECFTETFGPDVLVKGSFTAKEGDYNFLAASVTNEQGHPVITDDYIGADVKFSFTTQTEGNVNICVENKGEKYMKINFEILVGLEAGDIAGVASDEDLRPIERQLVQLDRTMESIKTTTSYIVSREEEKITQSDSVSFKLYMFSIITMIVMAAISFFQAKYLKTFFRSKKLI
jgi:hypothetical protein